MTRIFSKPKTDEDPQVADAIRRVLDGDTEAFAVLVEVSRADVAAVLSRRLDAQDVQEVAQDAFVRVYRSLPQFHFEAPFRSWVQLIARRAAMDFWRRRYRKRETPFSALESPCGDDDDDLAVSAEDRLRRDADAAERREAERLAEMREALDAAMALLAPEDRALVQMVALEGVPMAEAARAVGCSLTAAKVRAFRARKRLKSVLEELLPERRRT